MSLTRLASFPADPVPAALASGSLSQLCWIDWKRKVSPVHAKARWWTFGLLRLTRTVLLCVLLAALGFLLIVYAFLSVHLHALR